MSTGFNEQEEHMFSNPRISMVNIPFSTAYEIIDFISDSVFRMPIFRTVNKVPYLFGHELLNSAAKTLMNAYTCLTEFSYTDSMTLLRSWRDKLAQFLFISYAMETASFKAIISDILDSHLDADTIDAMLYEKIDKWIIDAIASKSSANKEESVGYGVYIAGIKQIESEVSSEKKPIETCLKNYFGRIFEYNTELNNCTHLNGYRYSLMNLEKAFYKPQHLTTALERVCSMVYLYTCQFLALIILIRPYLVTTSEYVDCLELGLSPKDGCQYDVPDFVLTYLDIHNSSKRTTLRTYLHEHVGEQIRI